MIGGGSCVFRVSVQDAFFCLSRIPDTGGSLGSYMDKYVRRLDGERVGAGCVRCLVPRPVHIVRAVTFLNDAYYGALGRGCR